jgi:hypothetical protein
MAKGGKSRVSSLSVALSLNSAAFTKGLEKARKNTRRFGKRIAKTLTRVAKFGTAMSVAALAGIAYFTRQAMKAIDETAKWSDRIGIGIKQLTGFEHAAVLTGVSVQQLHTGLQRMTRRISEAAVGTGEARGVLAELNLDVAKLNQLAPDQQFLAIAAAMKKTKLRGDQVRQTVKIFDMEAGGLVNTLRMGKEGLQEAVREADRLGLSISRFDAGAVEEANNALARMSALFKGAFRIMAIQVAPLVTEISERFRVLGETILPKLGTSFKTALESTVLLLAAIGDGIVSAIKGFALFGVTVMEVSEQIVRVSKKINAVYQTIRWGLGGARPQPTGTSKIDTLQDYKRRWLDLYTNLSTGPSMVDRATDLLNSVNQRRLMPAAAPAPVAAPNKQTMTREQGEAMLLELRRLVSEIGRVGILS